MYLKDLILVYLMVPKDLGLIDLKDPILEYLTVLKDLFLKYLMVLKDSVLETADGSERSSSRISYAPNGSSSGISKGSDRSRIFEGSERYTSGIFDSGRTRSGY